jgi:catechol 2,3-dioxygenase-like lactoylglutathione lyase family enzyme
MTFSAKQLRVARPTQQLEKVVEFYTAGLGLEVIGAFKNHQGYDGVMVGGKHISFHLEFTVDAKNINTAPPGNENLLVFYFDKVEDIQQIKKQFHDLGYFPVAPENPYWETNAFTFRDPDGWHVLLHHGLYEIT